jgi:hypothetical protein
VQQLRNSTCDYFSFAPSENAEQFFIKHTAQGTWDARLNDLHANRIRSLKEKHNDFDARLKFMFFGPEGTHIIEFNTGFIAEVEGKQDHKDHPLYKVRAVYFA